jgi:hypothetical protein
MNKATLAILTILICVPSTALLVLRRKLKSQAFKPNYSKRESVLAVRELGHYIELAPRLERIGMRLLPGVAFQQFTTVKKDLSSKEASRGFSALDGRTIQFLLVKSARLEPLAVLHLGGDGAPPRVPDHWLAGVKFCSALLESIGIPEIVIYETDMKDPERVVHEIQEILRGGRLGVIHV